MTPLQPGPLSPGMDKLLTPGRSVLHHHVHGLLTFHCADIESDDYIWTHEYGDGLLITGLLYVGERGDDGWITAPSGGWGKPPVRGRMVEVRTRRGEVRKALSDSFSVMWVNDGHDCDIISFRLVDEAAGESGCGHTEVGLSCRDGRATGTCFKCKVTLSADELAAMSADEDAGESGSSAAPIPTEPIADRWADLERLAAKAKVGPWMLEVGTHSLWVGPPKAVGGKVGDIVASFEYGPDYTLRYCDQQEGNARFIAAANPSTVLELIAAARAKEAGE